jgi:hypothetical protein
MKNVLFTKTAYVFERVNSFTRSIRQKNSFGCIVEDAVPFERFDFSAVGKRKHISFGAVRFVMVLVGLACLFCAGPSLVPLKGAHSSRTQSRRAKNNQQTRKQNRKIHSSVLLHTTQNKSRNWL